jgi:glutaredoxin-like YruB-family protein
MEKILSINELREKISQIKKSYLLLYKSESEQSMCAYKNLELAFKSENSTPVFTVDVSNIPDVHQHLGITTVPTLVLFERGNLTGIIKGCHEPEYYKSLEQDSQLNIETNKRFEKPAKRVTVYSTPTCSWCNTLKTWLKKYNIRYTDIDVSADQRAAEELVRRSGQQGVPQTDINGKIVVGFDQIRLKELLEIS